jgi:hypothetical protein
VAAYLLVGGPSARSAASGALRRGRQLAGEGRGGEVMAIGKEVCNIADDVSKELIYLDLLKRKSVCSSVIFQVWFHAERRKSKHGRKRYSLALFLVH